MRPNREVMSDSNESQRHSQPGHPAPHFARHLSPPLSPAYSHFLLPAVTEGTDARIPHARKEISDKEVDRRCTAGKEEDAAHAALPCALGHGGLMLVSRRLLTPLLIEQSGM